MMRFFNKILGKADIAVVRRSYISILHKHKIQLQGENAELKEAKAQLQGKDVQLRAAKDWRRQYNGLFPLMNSLSNAYICGPPSPKSRMALVMGSRHLELLTDVLAACPDSRLEFIGLHDFSEESPRFAPVACPLHGTRAVPVGPVTRLRQRPFLERVLYADGLSEQERNEAVRKLVAAASGYFYLIGQSYVDQDCQRDAFFIETWAKQLEELAKRFNDLQSIRVFAGKVLAISTGNPARHVISRYAAGLHPAVRVRSDDVVLLARAAFDGPVRLGDEDVRPEHVYLCAPEGAAERAYGEDSALPPLTRLAVRLNPCDAEIDRLPRGEAAMAPDRESRIAATVDALVSEHAIRRLDYILLDLGGGELSALRGAAETLEKHRPNLAVALHNDPMDLLTIPEYLLHLGLGYRLYLGHHSPARPGTFLYATVRPKK